MKTYIKKGMLALCVCVCLSGCSGETEKAGEEKTVQGTGEIAQEETVDSFPESYSEKTEKVQFDCELEVPEEFEISNFHIPKINGSVLSDAEAIYAKYVEGKTIAEEHHEEPTEVNERGNDTYILEDGTLIGATEGFIYQRQEVGKYRSWARSSEIGAPQETFAFASAEDCIQEVKEKLKEIGCPVEEYTFGWFSTTGEEYKALEQQAVDSGLMDSGSANPEGFSEADNSYEIYGWQTYEGLQVLPWIMTSSMMRAFETYQKAPVAALYTEQGMLALAMTDPAYVFEPSEEAAQFLAFPEIAQTVIQKYEDMLDEEFYTVTRAKLALRTYLDEKQQPAAEPVWYFEVSDSEGDEVVLVNAVTGEEIFLR